jgi:hypothetical protein
VILETRLPRDDEGTRLFAVYEAFRVKEPATASQLLYPSRRLPHETYMELIDDLRAIRTDCNHKMFAVKWRRSSDWDISPSKSKTGKLCSESEQYEAERGNHKAGRSRKDRGKRRVLCFPERSSRDGNPSSMWCKKSRQIHLSHSDKSGNFSGENRIGWT